MNAAGRDALRAAGLAGVRQIFGAMRDAYGGRCGLAVLHDASMLGDHGNMLDLYGLDGITRCPVCQEPRHEYPLVAHLQDTHGLDFIGLAEKMPVTDELGA